MSAPPPDAPLAVLVSGGLDSSVLLAEEARRRPAVHPLYVRFGLLWEQAELAHLCRFLAALAAPSEWGGDPPPAPWPVRPLAVLDVPVRDVYGEHWALTGRDVPGADTPDEAVFLPGRNVLLLGKALLWCHLHAVPALALAPLAGNPFPDATPAFFDSFAAVVNRAVEGRVRVCFPYRGLSKRDVLARGRGLPLEHTFSCLRPVAGGHCGACNKCAERWRVFAAAGVADPTTYHRRDHV